MMGSPRLSGPVIKLRCATWPQLAAIYERDLKRGSLFIRTSAKLPLGKETRVDIVMPTGSVVTVEGRVAYHIDSSDRGAGLELVLNKLPPSQMWLLESALQHAGAEAATPEDTAQEDAGAARAEEELIAALEAELRSLRALNPHQVLGLSYGHGEPEARAAFAELSKRYHPDRFARFQSPRARTIAADIFVVLREAYRPFAEAAGRRAAGPSRATPARGVPILERDPAAPVPIDDRKGSVPMRRPTPAMGVPAVKPGTPAQGVPVVRPGTPAQGVPVMRQGTPAQGVPIPRPGTPAQGVPIVSRPPGESPVPLPPPPVVVEPTRPAQPRFDPNAQVVSFKPTVVPVPEPAAHSPAPARPAPAAPPPPAGPSQLDADFLFGDLGAAPAPPAPIALDDPRLVTADALLADGKLDDAQAIYEETIRENPTHRAARAGRELVHGLRKSAAGEREAALRHFEAALEIEPWSERAARELAALRRAATERGKGLLSKLLWKGDG